MRRKFGFFTEVEQCGSFFAQIFQSSPEKVSVYNRAMVKTDLMIPRFIQRTVNSWQKTHFQSVFVLKVICKATKSYAIIKKGDQPNGSLRFVKLQRSPEVNYQSLKAAKQFFSLSFRIFEVSMRRRIRRYRM